MMIHPTPRYQLRLDNVTEKYNNNSIYYSISPTNRTNTVIRIHKYVLWHYKTKQLKVPITLIIVIILVLSEVKLSTKTKVLCEIFSSATATSVIIIKQI